MGNNVGIQATRADEYDFFYRTFNSPLMRQVRREAYGEDIGQHSWVSADELRQDGRHLGLSPSCRLLDLGSGPCGPLTFVIHNFGCTGVGLELSSAAIEIGYCRAAELGIEKRFSARVVDLAEGLPSDLGTFDCVLAIDLVLHIRDRESLFRRVAGLLHDKGRFLLTDAGVLTGAISNEEIRLRSVHGYTEFVPPGWNERLLEAAGFRIAMTEDRTMSVLRTAERRLAAMHKHREGLEQLSGVSSFATQKAYLATVADLARRKALSRVMYLVELSAHHAD